MEFNGQSLDSWFERKFRRNHAQFPQAADYATRYENFAGYMYQNVHTQVTPGAISRDGGHLTDHGPDHIRKVIQRATELLQARNCDLTPYEMYLLLMAIHFHDVGNVLGRTEHEKKAQEVMHTVGTIAGHDDIEKQTILRIAKAHGGIVNGSKDAIRGGGLLSSTVILGKPVREQVLAAILRFADELADDRERASGFLLKIAGMHKDAEIFHRYAHSLHSVVVRINDRAIDLHFDISFNEAMTKYRKYGSDVFLLDEILERTLKMHYERIYCMTFLRGNHIDIEEIRVQVTVGRGEASRPIQTCGFVLRESGYPTDGQEIEPERIYKVCPALDRYADWEEQRVCGEVLVRRL